MSAFAVDRAAIESATIGAAHDLWHYVNSRLDSRAVRSDGLEMTAQSLYTQPNNMPHS